MRKKPFKLLISLLIFMLTFTSCTKQKTYQKTSLNKNEPPQSTVEETEKQAPLKVKTVCTYFEEEIEVKPYYNIDDILKVYPQLLDYKEIIDNTTPLESLLTKEYDLGVLNSFFEGANYKGSYFDSIEGIGFKKITANEINKVLPFEVIRVVDCYSKLTSEKISASYYLYAVYKVKQGGYFYVQLDLFGDSSNYNLCAFYYVYLNLPKDISLFNDIKLGESTAADVIAIEPYIEFQNPYASYKGTAIPIDSNCILEIMYSRDYDKTVTSSLERYVVIYKDIRVVSRNPFFCSKILPMDLRSTFGNKEPQLSETPISRYFTLEDLNSIKVDESSDVEFTALTGYDVFRTHYGAICDLPMENGQWIRVTFHETNKVAEFKVKSIEIIEK